MRCQKGVFRGALIVILVMSLSLFLSFSDIAKASESSWLDKAQEMMNKDDDLKQKGRADEEVIKGKEGGLAERARKEEGQSLIEKGKAMMKKGEEMMKQGRELIEKGEAMMP
jgi:hypothetical protein